MDNKTFAIAILSTTSAIFLVGLLVVLSRPLPASADGMTASGGGYVITVGALTDGGEELLYVIDVADEKLAVYRFDVANHAIQIVQGIDLAEQRRAAEAAQRGSQAPGGNRGRYP